MQNKLLKGGMQIYIILPTKTMPFDVDLNQPISKLTQKILERFATQFPPDQMFLLFNDQVLRTDKTLKEYNIGAESKIQALSIEKYVSKSQNEINKYKVDEKQLQLSGMISQSDQKHPSYSDLLQKINEKESVIIQLRAQLDSQPGEKTGGFFVESLQKRIKDSDACLRTTKEELNQIQIQFSAEKSRNQKLIQEKNQLEWMAKQRDDLTDKKIQQNEQQFKKFHDQLQQDFQNQKSSLNQLQREKEKLEEDLQEMKFELKLKDEELNKIQSLPKQSQVFYSSVIKPVDNSISDRNQELLLLNKQLEKQISIEQIKLEEHLKKYESLKKEFYQNQEIKDQQFRQKEDNYRQTIENYKQQDFTQQQERQELIDKLKILELENQKMENQIKRIESMLSQKEIELEDLNKKLCFKETAIRELNNELQKFKDTIEQKYHQEKKLQNTLQQEKQQGEELKTTLESQLQSKQKEIKKLSLDLQNFQNTITALELERNSLNNEYSLLQQTVQKYKTDFDFANKQFQEMEENRHNQIVSLTQKRDKLMKIVQEFRKKKVQSKNFSDFTSPIQALLSETKEIQNFFQGENVQTDIIQAKISLIKLNPEAFDAKLKNISDLDFSKCYSFEEISQVSIKRTINPVTEGDRQQLFLFQVTEDSKQILLNKIFVIKQFKDTEIFNNPQDAVKSVSGNLLAKFLLYKFIDQLTKCMRERIPALSYGDLFLVEGINEQSGKFYICEYVLGGDFKRYNGGGKFLESGGVIGELANAFSYYSYFITQKQVLVSYVQGVDLNMYDPVVSTEDSFLDENDFGVDEMSLFLSKMKENADQKWIGRKYLAGLGVKIS